ncbi:MAG: response regulator transcription factor [Proteobacteria bacterium]|nr:response regulator transcription factor [Pseudomonadota bacterium]MCP4916126.1 response regulator transcription factor [Pseudomonadota bacterium]
MEAGAEGLRILLDTEQASWPVYVDPMLEPLGSYEEESEASDGKTGAQFGASVATADLNGDYLAKPVRPKVLLARIHALLRRASRPLDADGTLKLGAFQIDPRRRELTRDGVEVPLTDAEFLLLVHLAKHAGTVLSRDSLSLVLSGRPHDGLDRSIDQYISRLRRKLGDSGRAPQLLRTVRGQGYLLVGELRP